jgi:hypothetical protein
MARSSTGLGPRLLYALILGAIIAASLALRVWDPTPVARLRALAFDTYQRLDPRPFDPALPVRVVDIDEASLKAVGQWPWPRTVLAGDSAVKQSRDFILLAERHSEFLARYRAKDWDAAEALSRECEKTNTARLDTLYALYRERIAYFRMNPPPPNWDGTAEAMSK